MDLFIKTFLLLMTVQASLAVKVTLENGGTGIVDKEVTLGLESTVLQCDLTATQIGGSPTLEWTYASDAESEGSHVFLDGQIFYRYADKAFLQSPYSLGIKNLESSDSGYYKCRGVLANDSPSADSAKYNLIVLVPPSPQISCGFPSDRAITKGESAEFHCAEVVQQANPPPEFKWFKNGVEMPLTSKAYPAPVFDWFKNGVKLPLTSKNDSSYMKSNFSYDILTGILRFETVVNEDAGQYYCIARNKAGSSECSVKQIMAITPPYNEISCGFPQNSAITVGGSAEFQCAEVIQQADPPPLYNWFKDGVELPMKVVNNSVYPNSDFSYNYTTGILVFEKVARGDAGEYYCTVRNVAGSAQCAAARISTSAGTTLKAEILMSLLVGLLLLHLLL